MASRDKKSAVGRKPALAAIASLQENISDSSDGTQVQEETRKLSTRRKESTKRPITVKPQPKAKIVTTTKLLGRGKRTVANQKTLLKNGPPPPGSPTVIRKRPLSLRERIVPPRRNEIGEVRPIPRKRVIKQEPIDEEEIVQPAKRSNKRMKKAKDNESTKTIETFAIVIKKEPEQEDEEMIVLEVEPKEKRPKNAKKQKVGEKTATTEVVEKLAKTEKDFDELEKDVNAFESPVIDSLDLNVSKLLKDKKAITIIRRHSIEKFPVTIQDVKVHDDSAFIINPKTLKPGKKPIRSRPSSESRARSSPYSTRSDSPMRILRNGKTRRLQQFPLFDGLDSEYKMRRRLASDFSGSEIPKFSGYESDSSLSSSIQETIESDKTTDKEVQPKKELVIDSDKEKELLLKKEILETLENNPPDTEEAKQIVDNVSAAIKRSLSMEATTASEATSNQGNDDNTTDTNSTLCKSEPSTPSKADYVSDVPKLLGIMKQAFNDKGVTITEEPDTVERRKTRSSLKKTPEGADLPDTTISTLTAVGIALGPDITVTAEEVNTGQGDKSLSPPKLVKEVEEHSPENNEEPEPMEEEEDTVEEAEAELLEILKKRKIEDDKSTESTPSTSVNGGSPNNDGSSPVDEEKVRILKALGLQTLQEAEEARKKVVPKGENYTGTLKTVIKLSRCGDKKKSMRNPIKMTLQKKGRSSGKDNADKADEDEYKIMNEGSSWKHSQGGQSSDTAGAQRKSHYSNRSNMDGSSEHTSDGDTNQADEGAPAKVLLIPEKASSFSIHPGRLCKDECSYCFGKFGLFDTPCHIAQIKTVERQDKILANEKHLTRDSCLCDACYRHVDRKVAVSYMTKSVKRNALVAPAPRQNHCHVLGCNEVASNILKRKWLIKMRKAVCQVINIDLDNPGLHSIPTCKEHYAAVEHLMVCAMCKRRLARNHIHYLGPESNELQTVLKKMSIPVKLNEKPVVCKLCRYFASLVLKNPEDLDENGRNFFIDYKKRLLHFHNVEPMEDSDPTEPIMAPLKQEANVKQESKKRKRDKRHHNDPPVLEPQVDIHDDHEPNDTVPSSESRPESPSDYTVDYRNLIPSIAMDCLNDVEITKKSSLSIRRISKEEAQEKKRIRSDIAVQRLGSNPSISIRQMFPGEEDVPLNGCIEFNNVKERTPEGWEKCTSTIQYDQDTKALWQELQKPYGNQSSFLRHLVLLEKYFRNGDLILSPRASNLSVSYTESVQNRLKAYDNISSSAGPVQPLTMLPFNNPKLSFNTTIEKITDKTLDKIDKSQTTIIPVAMSTPNANVVVNQAQLPKNTPLTITQATNIATIPKSIPIAIISTPTIVPPLSQITTTPNAPPKVIQPANVPAPIAKSKPPGLISLQQAQANKLQPIAPANPKLQSQKIKFPITKNWRPKLIPIDPNSKHERKPGLVQVISGGKPYHITLEDYKKMCAIKRTFDLRQKRLQETKANPNSLLKPAHKLRAVKTPPPADHEENSCDAKLDRLAGAIPAQIPSTVDNKMPMLLPKIPKSLTVIPQTVVNNKSRSNSPNQVNAKIPKQKS